LSASAEQHQEAAAVTLKDRLAGKFIVFDGPDGSGKGTQIERLARVLAAEGASVVCTRDPGGTAIGDQIREILLHKNLLTAMDVRCEALLFMASRAQLVGEVIGPAVRAGKVVICDRFISATCAYQGAAGSDVRRIVELGRFAVGESWPQLTLGGPAGRVMMRWSRGRLIFTGGCGRSF
jgi:dTMP kinase